MVLYKRYCYPMAQITPQWSFISPVSVSFNSLKLPLPAFIKTGYADIIARIQVIVIIYKNTKYYGKDRQGRKAN